MAVNSACTHDGCVDQAEYSGRCCHKDQGSRHEHPRATPQLVLLDVPPRLSISEDVQFQPASAWLLEKAE